MSALPRHFRLGMPGGENFSTLIGLPRVHIPVPAAPSVGNARSTLFSTGGSDTNGGTVALSGAKFSSGSGSVFHSVRSGATKASGKHYVEFVVHLGAGGYLYAGFCGTGTLPSSGGSEHVGNAAFGLNSAGIRLDNLQTYGTGSVTANSVDNVETLDDSGAVVGLFADVDLGFGWVSLNGVWLKGDPATGASPLFTGLPNPLHYAVSAYGDGSGPHYFFIPTKLPGLKPTGSGIF